MNVNSVTKGVMALLAGIALDQGCIQSVDQKVMDFFPDYAVKRGEKTIAISALPARIHRSASAGVATFATMEKYSEAAKRLTICVER